MVPGNFSWIRYSTNTRTDVAPDNLNPSEHSSWQMIPFDGVNLAFMSVELGICVVGLVLNCFVVHTSKHIRRKTAGTKWITLVAVWDNVALLGGSLRTGTREVFGTDSLIEAVIGCRLFVYLFWFGATNASAHLACLACDRAFVIASPRKHYTVRWDQWISKISIGLTLLYCLMASPHLYERENDSLTCKMKSGALRVYQALFATVFSTFAHFVLILFASIVFVYKMRYRKNKNDKLKTFKPDTVKNLQTPTGTSSGNQLISQIPCSSTYVETNMDEAESGENDGNKPEKCLGNLAQRQLSGCAGRALQEVTKTVDPNKGCGSKRKYEATRSQ